jgi:ABC-type multidrug transport system ATPase subunit
LSDPALAAKLRDFMLTIHNVFKTYGGTVRALNGVSLEIPPGMFGLLGPNGAGKSTLMRSVATLVEPDQGSISFDGIDVIHQPDSLRRVLGYLPQEFGVYPRTSARDMLDHLAILKGITAASQRRDIVDRLLQITNLWDVRTRYLTTFSGGMRQRFGIAQALIGDPRLIIVDEPTAGLDPEERNRFLGLLTEIGEDVTVILSTHIVDDVADVCGGMAILVSGQVKCEGAPQTVLEGLRGSIWRKTVTREELSRVSASGDLAVLGTRWHSGRLVVHVMSATSPGAGFEPAPPDLQDLYFHTLRQTSAIA